MVVRSLCVMVYEPLHNFGVGVLHTAQVTAESVLIQFFMGLGVPKAAGVGADLVSQNDGAVGKAAELQLEVHQNNAALRPQGLQKVVYAESVVLDGLDLLGGGQLQGQGVTLI